MCYLVQGLTLLTSLHGLTQHRLVQQDKNVISNAGADHRADLPAQLICTANLSHLRGLTQHRRYYQSNNDTSGAGADQQADLSVQHTGGDGPDTGGLQGSQGPHAG